jgi:hypothetical protein
MFWAWNLALLQVNQSFGLDVVYHLEYFYVLCCECGDTMVIGANIGTHNMAILSLQVTYYIN